MRIIRFIKYYRWIRKWRYKKSNKYPIVRKHIKTVTKMLSK